MFNAINEIDIYNILLEFRLVFYCIIDLKIWNGATSYADKKYISYTIKKPFMWHVMEK